MRGMAMVIPSHHVICCFMKDKGINDPRAWCDSHTPALLDALLIRQGVNLLP